MDASTLEVLGTTADHTDCELCGRQDLKGTVALRDTATGEVVHYGSDCAARAAGWTARETRDLVKQADRAAHEARMAADRARNDAEMKDWQAFLLDRTGIVEIGPAIQALGGYTAAHAAYREQDKGC